MSLRWKIATFLCVVSAMFTGSTFLIQRLVVFPGFIQAEHAEAAADLDRCVEALRRDWEHISTTARDWGAWDESYTYIEDRNQKYVADNLLITAFTNNGVNLLALVNTRGELVWGEVRDLNTKELIPTPELFKSLGHADHILVAHEKPESVRAGILMTEVGPMLVGSRPIVTNENKGPVRGAMIMGRLINQEKCTELANRTRVKLNLWSIQDVAMPAQDRAALARISGSDSVWIKDNDPKTLQGYALARDVFGKPAMILRADLPRSISNRGRTAVHVATTSGILGALAILAVVWLLLQQTVIGPLTKLTTHAVRVGSEGDLRIRLNMVRTDEIGVLAREFDSMVAQLAESRAQMLKTARKAGMAEVATDVLHNVGNVLNSLNVSAGVVCEKLRNSEIPSVGLAARMMLDHKADLGEFITTDERGRQLPDYLAELARFLSDEQNAMLKEMSSLTGAIEHINQVVNLQQTHSCTESLVELVDPAELIEEAVKFSKDALDRHDVKVVRQYEPVGDVRMNKHKVVQILINLVSNAKKAVAESGRRDKQITLKLGITRGSDQERIAISVIDNGVGIAREHLSKIFGFGFSTREDGHGFGLHGAANMAGEMGGSLVAASDGPGQGAAFTLEVPLVRQKVSC